MGQPGDVTVIATLSIQNGANAAITRAGEACDGWINTTSHTTRDALPTAITTLGTLIRTLNDGIVWEVTSVGPVGYTAWSGSGGVTSFKTRTGAVVPVAGDYAASQINNDSATVAGTHVSDALDALKAANGSLVFQTLAALTTFNATGLANGTQAFIVTPDDSYELVTAPSAALIAATNGVTIVQPTTPNTVRWVRRGLAAGYVANWYVNASTGSDVNDGSSALPLKSSEELARRLVHSAPGGSYVPKQDTNIYFAAGSYGEFFLRGRGGTGFFDGVLTVHCEYAASAVIALSSVVDTVAGAPGTGVRGQVTTTGPTSFTAGARITATSGPNAGAVTYSTGQNSSTKNHFVKEWFDYNVVATCTIAPGTTCTVDTLLVSFARTDIEFDGPGYFELHDAKLSGEINAQFRDLGAVNFVGCEYASPGGQNYIYGSADWWNCNFTSGVVGFSEQFPGLRGCIVQAGASVQDYPGSTLGIFAGNCINGGNISALEPGSSLFIENNLEFCNGGATTAVEAQTEGTIVVTGGLLWGASTSYAIGVKLGSLCKIVTPSNTAVSIPATQQVQMTGQNFPYTAMPRSIDRAACVWAISPDTTATSIGPDVATVANWYVNASTGNDANDGSVTHPLASVEELSRRLCPRGEPLQLAPGFVNVFIAAGSYGTLTLNVHCNDPAPFDRGVVVWGTVSQSITGNVLSVVDTAIGTARGQITVASGTLVANKRISYPPTFLNGPTGEWWNGVLGHGVTTSTGLNANAQNSFVANWLDAASHAVNLASGGPVSVDTLQTTIASLQVDTSNGYVAIANCVLPNVPRAVSTFDGTFFDYLLEIVGCDISGSWSEVRADLLYCRLIGATVFDNSAPRLYGLAIQAPVTFERRSYADIRGGTHLNGGTVAVSLDSVAELGATELENGSSGLTAFQVSPTGSLTLHANIWGLSAPYGVGFELLTRAHATIFGLVTYLQTIPATVQIVVDGHRHTWDDVPVFYPDSDAGFAAAPRSFGGLDTNPYALGFSAAVASVANWYVNASTGSDANDGRTSGTAFATSEKLCQVLCPGGMRYVPRQNVTIHFAAGSYGDLFLNVAFPASTSLFGAEVLVVCDYTSSAPITLSGVVNTVAGPVGTGVRGQVTTTGALGFTANARITATSGASAGAVTYSTGQNANSKNHFVKEWFDYSSFALKTVAPGTTVTVDSLLVSFSRVDITTVGLGYFELHDAHITNPINCDSPSTGGNINLVGCEYAAGTFTNGLGDVYGSPIFANCSFTGDVECSTEFAFFTGCVFQTGSRLMCFPGAIPELRAGNCFNGGNLYALEPGGVAYVDGNVEFANGTHTSAISVVEGARIVFIGNILIWGASNNYDVGVTIASLAAVSSLSNTVVSVPATQQVVMTGQNFSYSQMPRSIDRAGCVWAIDPDTTASSTGAPNKINTTLTDVQPATDIIASPASADQYQIKAYLEVLIAGTLGKLIVNEIHTGPSGTVQTTPVTAPIDITTVGNAGQGIVALRTNGSSAVRYSVTSAPGTFTKGSLSYSLSISVTQEPN